MKATEIPSLFTITWPIFIEILLYMLMGNADTLMLSQYSDESVAAVGVANQVLSIIIVMFGFVTTGTAVLIAQHIGANEELSAQEIAVVSLVANALFGLAVSACMLFFSEPILHVMGLSNTLLPRANAFMKIVGGFSFVQALIMTIGAILRSNGYTRDTMLITITMNILNVIGNFLVIFGPFGFPILGEAGVAMSTTISRIIGLILISMVLLRRVRNLFTSVSLLHLPSIHLRNLLKIGIPAAGEQLSYNASQVVITFFVTLLGTEALTTKVYAQNLTMFIFLFSVAISEGEQIIIGQLVGAKRLDTAYHSCLRALKITIAISISMAAVFSFFREPLFSIFTHNHHIIETGSILIMLTLLLEPGRAFNLVIISSLRASGDVKFPVMMGILSMWGISIPVAYMLGIHFGMGLVGVWIAYIIDEWFRGLCMLWRWRSRIWETKSFVTSNAS
ncbi:MATE family efflux transporter [Ectobacillus polymachus]|uniref:MATE family efflux transporter n=1 Tax=Ectobacillus polymachus TaxID=1508806 RepID=UPI003A88B7BB